MLEEHRRALLVAGMRPSSEPVVGVKRMGGM